MHRRVGFLVAGSMLLNAAWIAVVQLGGIGWSVLVIAVLLGVLGVIFRVLRSAPREPDSRAGGVVEAIVLDGTIGLYLGWVTIATAANVAAWLTELGFLGFGLAPDVWGVAVVLLAAAAGIATAIAGRGRLAPAVALAWGLCWLGVARLAGEPASAPVGVVAFAAAGAVLVTAVVCRLSARRPGGAPLAA